ncbi:MAG: hypothetical protein RLZZ84_1737, partial [Pseudomonadota bacterium]
IAFCAAIVAGLAGFGASSGDVGAGPASALLAVKNKAMVAIRRIVRFIPSSPSPLRFN